MSENNVGGRPRGKTCDFVYVAGDKEFSCRKTARVVITQNVRGQAHLRYRCWKHYPELENALRRQGKGAGNIVRADLIVLGEEGNGD